MIENNKDEEFKKEMKRKVIDEHIKKGSDNNERQ